MLGKLMKNIDEHCNNVDIDLILKAYNLAYDAHKSQKRESGEPYIIHPIEVACILAEMGMDTATIVAGLLHDVIEDTEYSYEEISAIFNPEIADLVEGVTKLGKIEFLTKEEQQADNVRKMLLAMAKDIRVILIKLADRLHNMRTLRYMPIKNQKEKAKETLDIFAPLAHRLGMSKIKWELEDLAFRYLNPNEYYELVDEISEKRVEREEYIKGVVTELQKNLEESGVTADIDGRPKHFYSIYRKMVTKNKTLDQIFDLTAIRILVGDIRECYTALGIVHTMYKPIPGRFKDYIAMPKPNMYQSLHSTVIGPQGKSFEIQIRTFEMHRIAEYGIAAHWKYKEGITENQKGHSEDIRGADSDTKLTWVREMLDWQKETNNPEEFMENFKIDLFADEVFVFTPKGTVINLPNCSTPVDFAYKIHTDIGNRCIGGKVNGKIVPLDYKLKTGEIVEILTSGIAKGPNMEWLNTVKSNQAKSKIRSWFKKVRREENISKGKDVVEKESKRQGYNFASIAKGPALEQLIKKYNMNSIEDLFVAVAIGTNSASILVSKLRESFENGKGIDNSEENALKEIKEQISKEARKEKKNIKAGPGVMVKGEKNILVRFAKCCNPVPGDAIIGYITKGRGVSLHRTDCQNVRNLIKEDETKIVEASWGEAKNDAYIAEIRIKADDRKKLLTDVLEVINLTDTNVQSMNAKTLKDNIAYLTLKIKIVDISHLDILMKNIKRLKGVIDVFRTKS
ncbi:RelA/SpoT family protein [Clostridium akagii]|uniref:RelA/SpoT family protein n=1 Tax=Clostridium akagii TaxID=91623 RepID=UPI00047A3230|nr:bifunctional (p)ppGpp synthetase/guanosine-3',5'-bis(diphosphate) 3'-pyrophosphohydrolase [Clostridium akagii]